MPAQASDASRWVRASPQKIKIVSLWLEERRPSRCQLNRRAVSGISKSLTWTVTVLAQASDAH
ncbi:MAG: hypothetical protein MPL62_01920 [Alphaproteobacteria bacterium]|nr:hypothetical protein [Alphaproteobacteria bacterium]